LQARREDLLESRRQIADALQRYTCLFGLWKEAATRALDVLSATAWPAPWTEPGSVHACLGWLLLRLWEARGGILLADSLEKTLPQGRLDGLWSVLEGVGIALGVQILASTRDPQLLRAADRCLKDRSRLFLMRLPEQDGRMVAGRSLDRLDLLREPGWPGR
ncbi:MAG: hypothetical protein Q4F72_10575, partial [Desulfovibrionaceae bacterium]|nr:hypothetical protein [Desulfovibrionaceae bacterium]